MRSKNKALDHSFRSKGWALPSLVISKVMGTLLRLVRSFPFLLRHPFSSEVARAGLEITVRTYRLVGDNKYCEASRVVCLGNFWGSR
jgi:hypothetical protein